MADGKNVAPVAREKRRAVVCLALLLVALIAILVIGGISLARYTQSAEEQQSAGIGAFRPVIACGESWEDTESFQIKDLTHPASLSFAVSNDGDDMPVLVIVELTPERVLPLEYALYLGEELLTPDAEQTGDTVVYTYLLQNAEAEFSLRVSFARGENGEYLERDERFNGLTETMRMVVTCEQAQIGGAE